MKPSPPQVKRMNVARQVKPRAELVEIANSGGTDKVTNLARLIVAIGGLDRD
jgi:hypothetical protein